MDNVHILNQEQRNKILQFQDLTGIDQIRQCREILEAHDWNVEAAVQDTFNEREGAPTVFRRPIHREERAPPVILQPVNQRVYQYPGRRPQNIFEWTYFLLTFPVRFMCATFIDILQAVLGIFRTNARRYITDGVGDVTHLITSFESTFGRCHPAFYQGTYSQALSEAKQQLQFLLVYLHKEDHHNTGYFCREILCNQRFVDFVNSRMIVWACSTNRPEGHHVSQALRQQTHPFLAVIVLRDYKMSVVARFEGHVPGPQELIARLEQVMTENEVSLVAARAQRAESSFNQSLRLQQDEAYLQSLHADQEKEKKRQEEREKLVAEEMRKKREIEERQIQVLETRKQKTEIERQLPPEPEPEHPDCIRVVLKIPSGHHIERRFLRSQSLKWLFFYVFCHKDCPDDFQIVTNFPRQILACQPVDGGTDPPSFQEIGFGRSEMLFIHDNQA